MQPMQETTAWVVVNEEGRPMFWAFEATEQDAVLRFIRGAYFEYKPWSFWQSKGYTVRRVRITEVAE